MHTTKQETCAYWYIQAWKIPVCALMLFTVRGNKNLLDYYDINVFDILPGQKGYTTDSAPDCGRLGCRLKPQFTWDVEEVPGITCGLRRSGAWFNISMSSYQCRKSHCGDKMILWPSCLHNGISYTDTMASLYWIRALFAPSGAPSTNMN